MGGNKQEILGLNSDHIVTIYTFFSCLLLSGYTIIKNKYPIKKIHILSICLLVIYFIINVTVYDVSATTLTISHAIYIVISLCFIVIFDKKPILLSYLIASGLIFVSSFLLIQLYHLGFGDWERLTFPVFSNNKWSYFPSGYESSSDPNILAFMLCISSIYILFTLPNKFIINFIFVLSVACSFLTLSRSSLLSFFISFLIVNMYSFFVLKKFQFRFFILFILSIFLSFIVIKTVPFKGIETITTKENIEIKNNNSQKILEMTLREKSNSDRIARLNNAGMQLSNLKSFFIGNGIGYSSSTKDPHNFYLSTIIDSGVFILTIIIMILIKPLLFLLKNGRSSNFVLGCMFITIYFLLISLFYWQVRVLYFSNILLFTFINMNSIKNDE
ncbi:hypothetical protein [Arsenophonus nasoniae]|uniref:hypothetical protein n=1 Tax=Arsenophonus nasoniae TaxID=638 RepID=UPI0038793651